jgi:glycosyltransferase involved in cell wall biosynthesis
VGARLLKELSAGDTVIAVTNPPALPYVALAAARRRRARFVLLVHDVYPDVLVATGMASARSPVVRAWARASRALYDRADHVVLLGRDMAVRVGTGNTRIIPNWGDAEEIVPDPAAGAEVRARLGLDGRFVVQFMGNIGRTHGIDVLLEAARRLRSHPEVHLLFVGWGGRRAQLEQAVREEALGNVTVQPPAPREELSAFLNAGHLAVIAFRPGMAGVSVPSRMYNVMAAGRPLLAVADEDSELVRVVREERCGYVARPGDAASVVATIEQAYAQRAELDEIGRRGRAAVLRQYTRTEVAQQWQQLILELTPSPPPATA